MTELNSDAGLSVRKELSRTIKEGGGGKFCDAMFDLRLCNLIISSSSLGGMHIAVV